jgi:cystathionine beta-lyase/cystathionine gamma-synthase
MTFSRNTRALRTRVDATQARPATTPLYQNSAFESGSSFFYSRKSNPNVAELEDCVRILEGAQHALATTTGMSAIHLALSLVPNGSTVLVNKLVYGCSLKLIERVAGRQNWRVLIRDLDGVLEDLPKIDCAFFETPTNPFLKEISIKKVGERLGPDCLIIVDNTWAGPLYQSPLEHGAHLSLHSATKYFSGHSDVMGGLMLMNSETLYNRLFEERFYTGANLDPHSAWLLRRSLQTLPIRMERQIQNALKVAEWLNNRPEVKTVYFPKGDGEQLKQYGGILFFEFQETLGDVYKKFSECLQLFSTGTGMAAVTSMIAQPHSGSHASLSDAQKCEMNIGKNLVRLCIGLESVEDLIQDLSQGLERLRPSVNAVPLSEHSEKSV